MYSPKDYGNPPDLRKLIERGRKYSTNHVSAIRNKILDNSAVLQTETHDAEELKQCINGLDEALTWSQEHNSFDNICTAAWSLAIAHSRLSNYSKAADYSILVWEKLEMAYRGEDGEQSNAGVFDRFPNLFSCTCRWLILADRKEELLAAIEWSKGRRILSQRGLRIDVNFKNKTIFSFRDRLYRLLAREGAHYLSYLMDEEDTYCVLMTKNGNIYSHTIPIGNESLKKWVSTYMLEQPEHWRRMKILGQNTSALELLSPFISWISKYEELEPDDHICYSAHGYLNLFPLHYLHVGNQFLIEKHSVSRTHNALLLLNQMDQKANKMNTAFFVEVPTRSEFDENSDKRDSFGFLRAYFGKKIPSGIEFLTNADAEKEAVLASIKESQVVHFITHGVFSHDDNPNQTAGLLLANNGSLPTLSKDHSLTEDYLMSPQTIIQSGLKMSGNHISLQACVSAYSREGIAGDALGIESAFFSMGCSSMISAYWDVDINLSNSFFERFYKRWLVDKISKRNALRESMIEMMKLSPGPEENIHEWGGFGLIGDWR